MKHFNCGGIIHRSTLNTYLRKKISRKVAKKPSKNKMFTIKIPARLFVKLNAQDLEKIKKKILNTLQGIIRYF